MNEDARSWLRIPRPLDARIDGQRVTVVDISASAIRIEHLTPLPSEGSLRFEWQRASLDVRFSATSLIDEFYGPKQPVYESELRLDDDALPALEALIERYRHDVEAARRANLTGNFDGQRIGEDATLADLGSARSHSQRHFVSLRRVGGSWTRESTSDPGQPPDGFTVLASETSDQIRLLCLAWEESDDEGRELLRQFAAGTLHDSAG